MSEIKNDTVLLMKDVTMQFGGVVAVENSSPARVGNSNAT